MQKESLLTREYSDGINSLSVVDEFISLVDQVDMIPIDKTGLLDSLITLSKDSIRRDHSRSGEYESYLSDSYEEFMKAGEVYSSRILLVRCKDGVDIIYVCSFSGNDIVLEEENIGLGIMRRGKRKVLLEKGSRIPESDMEKIDIFKKEISKATEMYCYKLLYNY